MTEPWSTTHWFSMNGYLEGLSSNANWPDVSNSLVDLVQSKPAVQNPIQPDRIEILVATKWAKSEFDPALDWFFHEQKRNGAQSSDSSNLAQVLKSAFTDQNDQVVSWIKENKSSSNWNEEIIVDLGTSLQYRTPDSFTSTLINLADDEFDRYQVIADYVEPRSVKDELILKHSPEDLRNLIEASHLNPAHQAQLFEKIESASWPK